MKPMAMRGMAHKLDGAHGTAGSFVAVLEQLPSSFGSQTKVKHELSAAFEWPLASEIVALKMKNAAIRSRRWAVHSRFRHVVLAPCSSCVCQEGGATWSLEYEK